MLSEKVWAAPGQVAKVAGCWSTVLQHLQGPGLLSAAPSLSGGAQSSAHDAYNLHLSLRFISEEEEEENVHIHYISRVSGYIARDFWLYSQELDNTYITMAP